MSGSIAKNRLTIQLSFAIQLIVDLYEISDYTILLDCIEDVAVKTFNEDHEKIYLYQIKTKGKDEFDLKYIIKKEWFEKLYKHKSEFDGLDYEVNLVTNVDITENKQPIFVNDKANFASDIVENAGGKDEKKRLYLIKKIISEKEGIALNDVDLSKFYFIKTNLHTDTHKEQAKLIFMDFINRLDGNAEIAKARAFFLTLYDTLDSRFNNEINPANTNYDEIVAHKGYTKEEFNSALQTYMNESIPKTTDLFNLLNVKSIQDQRQMSGNRVKFLMDLMSDDAPFNKFIEEILKFIEKSTIDDLLTNCVNYVLENSSISPIYKDEGYIKFATAYVYYRFINGKRII